MTNTKGKRRGTRYMFSRLFCKHGVPLATYMCIYKVDFVGIKGMGTIQKGMPHKCYYGKTGRIYNITQHAVGINVNKKTKGKILAQRIDVQIEYIKHSKNRDNYLQWVKDYERKKKERKKEEEKKKGKEKGIWFELKHQPAPPREAYFVRKNGKEPELLELISYEFMTYGTCI
ncbi:LOW QUALITY PROTEIN: 60S ribosomal protein L21-like [Lacerta agilis]|uniref:LOW QUALITY PROTEIN: 60S ribosomal protein L21-like n=1 Tax=Lacerta agilis TaxID=80427 RepID=UPI0014199006|nr:LOW QUALITY PROTEIN: 60S ribosomal protein L21-like [Lacerta agilis]